MSVQVPYQRVILPLRVPCGLRAAEHPAVLARAMPQPVFDVVGLARFERILPDLPGPFLVIRVEHAAPDLAVGRAARHPGIFVPALVIVVVEAVRPRRPDHLVDGVRRCAETLLALPQSLLDLARLRDVHVDTDHAEKFAGGAETRLGVGLHDPVFAIGPQEARLDRERLVLFHRLGEWSGHDFEIVGMDRGGPGESPGCHPHRRPRTPAACG